MLRNLLIPLFILVLSCQQPEKTVSESRSLTINDEVSWNITLPDGWEVTSSQEIKRLQERGEKAMTEALGTEIETSHESLVTINKGPFNSLMANRQVYDLATDGPYESTQQATFEAILETYRNQGIRFDHELGVDTIGGFVFQTLSTTLYAPNQDKVILNQLIWDRLFEDYSLLINVNYNNEEDRETLVDLVVNSTFTEGE